MRAWGLQAVKERSFADHHFYTPREAAELEQAAMSCGADALLCTEKDVWNLRNVQFAKLPVIRFAGAAIAVAGVCLWAF